MFFVALALATSAAPAVEATRAADPCGRVAPTAAVKLFDDKEMLAIFNADQADRSKPAEIDWKTVTPRDQSRLARTADLLSKSRLKTGADFYHAAYVYQHGDRDDDILVAHALAMAATASGYPASWIAAASLDRYLQRIGKAQIYGTQFQKSDREWTQEPYNRALIADALREASCVPDLPAQKEQLKEWQRKLP